MHEVTFACCVRRYRIEQRKSTQPVFLWVNLGFIILKFVLPEFFYSLSYVTCVQSARYKCHYSNSCFHPAALCVGKSNTDVNAAVVTFEGVCILVARLRKIHTYYTRQISFVKLHGFCANSVFVFLSAFTKVRKATVSFVMSFLSVRMEQLNPHCTNVREIRYLIFFSFKNLSRKFKFF